MTAVLPIIIAVYEICFFKKTDDGSLRTTGYAIVFPLVFIILMSFVLMNGNFISAIFDGYTYRPFTLEQRLLTEPRVVLSYLSLLFFPHPSRLALIHDFPLSHSLISPVTTALAILIIAGLLFYAIYYARIEPVISFCIFWYFGNVFIESSFPPLEIIFEHRSYIPSMMVIFLAVFMLKRLHIPKLIKYSLLVVVVVLSSHWTYSRNNVWGDTVTFWQDNVEKYPLSARANSDLGTALSNTGKFDDALKQYKKAIEIDPEYALAYHNAGFILVRNLKTEEAIQYFEKALDIEPSAITHYRLSTALTIQGKYYEAYKHCLKATILDPENIWARRKLKALELKLLADKKGQKGNSK
jgi:hypothetical protein